MQYFRIRIHAFGKRTCTFRAARTSPGAHQTDQSCVHRQMKERYTTLRPYGEWLAEQTFGLTDAVASVSPDLLASPVASPRELGRVNPQAWPVGCQTQSCWDARTAACVYVFGTRFFA